MSHMTVLYSPLQRLVVGRENETTIENQDKIPLDKIPPRTKSPLGQNPP